MGAFDGYTATSPCPRCGDLHEVHGQTKFFAPEFGGLHGRWFRPGVRQPLDFDVNELVNQRVWEDEWFRVREPTDPSTLRVLAATADLFGCPCGASLATVLCFHLEAGAGATGTATLQEVALFEALADERALEVDFARCEVPWTGDFASWRAEVATLASEPPEQRAARVRSALARRFTPSPELHPWTVVVGSVTCEACGEARERSLWTSFGHPSCAARFLGPGWRGGELRVGARIPGDFREPHLTVATSPMGFGCRCGAGVASAVLRFAAEAGGITLVAASLRVVRGPEDLRDVDFDTAPQRR